MGACREKQPASAETHTKRTPRYVTLRHVTSRHVTHLSERQFESLQSWSGEMSWVWEADAGGSSLAFSILTHFCDTPAASPVTAGCAWYAAPCARAGWCHRSMTGGSLYLNLGNVLFLILCCCCCWLKLLTIHFKTQRSAGLFEKSLLPTTLRGGLD